MKKWGVLLIVIYLVVPVCFSQKPIRVEVEAKSGSDIYRILPFGENGVMLFYQSNERRKDDNERWFFNFYDTDFKKLWEKELMVRKTWNFRNFDSDNENLFLFFTKPYLKETTPILITTVNIKDGNHQMQSKEIPAKAVLQEFYIAKKNAYIGGHTIQPKITHIAQSCFSFTLVPFFTGASLVREKPVIFSWNLENNQSLLTETSFKRDAFVEDIQSSTKEGTANYVVKSQPPRKKQNKLVIYNVDANGNKEKSFVIKSQDKNRRLNTGKLYPLDEDAYITIGTYYAEPRSKIFYSKKQTEKYSTGIYFTKTKNGQQELIRYYNFTKFDKLIYSFNKKRTKRLIKKAERKEKKGKEISFNYQLLFHDIIKRDGQYLLIAEAYYPQYRTVYYTYYDFYGRPITTTRTIFEGYRYTDAIVAAIDINGELLWDNSFMIKNILTHNLKERVKVLFDGEDIILLYSSGGKIASKVIRNDEVVEGLDYTEIETSFRSDKVLEDYRSDIVYWYDNYFISYGYQKIKNRLQRPTKKRKRTVFYFNKVAFQ